MKKILFTIVFVLTALLTTGCSIVFAQPQYDYEEEYRADYACLDNYAQVDWSIADYDILYSYYDSVRVFLVIFGNHIYIIPYDYFYHYIVPRFKGRIIWRSYDWFCNSWGYSYYNSLWSYWYYHHNRPHWRPHYDYYYQHRNSGHDQPFIILKDSLKRPRRYRRQIPVQPRRDTMRVIPRNERKIVPRDNFPRSFNPSRREYRTTVVPHEPTITPYYNLTPPTTPVKHDDGDSARKKR